MNWNPSDGVSRRNALKLAAGGLSITGLSAGASTVSAATDELPAWTFPESLRWTTYDESQQPQRSSTRQQYEASAIRGLKQVNMRFLDDEDVVGGGCPPGSPGVEHRFVAVTLAATTAVGIDDGDDVVSPRQRTAPSAIEGLKFDLNLDGTNGCGYDALTTNNSWSVAAPIEDVLGDPDPVQTESQLDAIFEEARPNRTVGDYAPEVDTLVDTALPILFGLGAGAAISNPFGAIIATAALTALEPSEFITSLWDGEHIPPERVERDSLEITRSVEGGASLVLGFTDFTVRTPAEESLSFTVNHDLDWGASLPDDAVGFEDPVGYELTVPPVDPSEVPSAYDHGVQIQPGTGFSAKGIAVDSDVNTSRQRIAGTDDPVRFDAREFYDGGADAEFRWDFGDGTVSYDEIVEHAFDDPGKYTTRLTVDPGEEIDYGSVTEKYVAELPVAIGNWQSVEGPTAVISPVPSGLEVDDTVVFDSRFSTHPDGSIASREWTIRPPQDNKFGIEPVEATGEQVPFEFVVPGRHDVYLTVTDEKGNTSKTSRVVDVPRNKPIAGIETLTPREQNYRQSFEFDPSPTFDPDLDGIYSYEWDFGDGTTLDLDRPDPVSHEYDLEGEYSVTLTVTDGDGATASNRVDVTVTNRDPVPSFTVVDESTGESTPTAGHRFRLDATGSTDPDGDIVAYDWTLYRGEADPVRADPVATFEGSTARYEADLGVEAYTVELQVRDNAGETKTIVEVVDVEPNDPPTAVLDVYGADLSDDPVTLDAGRSSEPEGESLTYDWTVTGDGLSEQYTGETVTVTYDDPGNYDVTLVVSDPFGNQDLVRDSFYLENEAPDLTLEYSADSTTIRPGDTVAFTADASDNGSVVDYDWVGVDGSGATAERTFTAAGGHTVGVTVTDDDGATSSASVDLFVDSDPTAQLRAEPTNPEVGETVSFYASGSDADGGEVRFFWSDTVSETQGTDYTTESFDEPGRVIVQVTVRDDEGNTANANVEINVQEEEDDDDDGGGGGGGGGGSTETATPTSTPPECGPGENCVVDREDDEVLWGLLGLF